MITIRKIQLNNFLSHAKTELAFEKGQKLLIDGKSGSGKSGIVEGLIWCLYGKSRVDNNRNLIKHGKSAASVTVELEEQLFDRDMTVLYVITRNITKGGRHTVSIDRAEAVAGEEMPETTPVLTAGVRASQEYIETDILRSSYLLFVNSIAYVQDSTENFVKQPADKRKDIILEIINASAYDKHYERTREEITDRQNKTVISSEKVAFLNEQLKDAEEESRGLSDAQKDLKIAVQEKDTAENKVSKVSDAIKELESQKEAVLDLKKANSQYWGSIDMFRDHNKTAASKIEDIENIDLGDLKKQVDTIPGVEKQIKELDALEDKASAWAEEYGAIVKEMPVKIDFASQIEELKKQMIDVVSEEIYDCPELGKVCPVLKEKNDERAKKLEGDIQRYEYNQQLENEKMNRYEEKLAALGTRPMTDRNALSNLRTKLHDLLVTKGIYEKYMDKDKVIADAKKLIDDNNLQIAKYTDMVTMNEKKIASIEKQLAEANDIKIEWGRLKSIYEEKEQTVADLRMKIRIMEAAMRKHDELIAEIKKLKEENKDVVEEIEALQLLKEALGPRGIKAMVVDYVIPRLEDKINEILGKLSDFRVKLDTQKSSVKGDTTLEGLFITIVNELGEEFDYNNYSGGEKLKITVAITEALAEIQKCSFRILDELFVGLDEDSTQAFAEVMETLNRRFSQMICITHLRDIKEMFPDKITIGKINGTSKIL